MSQPWPRPGFIVQSSLPSWRPRLRAGAPIKGEVHLGLFSAEGRVVEDKVVDILLVNLGRLGEKVNWAFRVEGWLTDQPVSIQVAINYARHELRGVLTGPSEALVGRLVNLLLTPAEVADFTDFERCGTWPGRHPKYPKYLDPSVTTNKAKPRG